MIICIVCIFLPGNMLGALLGGLLYNAYGAKTMFRVSSIICFSSGLLYWIYLGPYGIWEFHKSRKRKGGNGDAGIYADILIHHYETHCDIELFSIMNFDAKSITI